MHHRKNIQYIRWLLYAVPIALLCFLLSQYIVLTGTVSYTWEASKTAPPFFSQWEPVSSTRSVVKDATLGFSFWRIIQDPVKIFVTEDRDFDTIAVDVTARVPHPQDLWVGFRGRAGNYIHGSVLQPDIPETWNVMQEGEWLMAQPEPVYASMEDFLTNHTSKDRILINDIDKRQLWFPRDIEHASPFQTDITLRGGHQFLVAGRKDETLEYTIDMEYIADVKPQDVSVYVLDGETILSEDTATLEPHIGDRATLSGSVTLPHSGTYMIRVVAPTEVLLRRTSFSHPGLIWREIRIGEGRNVQKIVNLPSRKWNLWSNDVIDVRGDENDASYTFLHNDQSIQIPTTSSVRMEMGENANLNHVQGSQATVYMQTLTGFAITDDPWDTMAVPPSILAADTVMENFNVILWHDHDILQQKNSPLGSEWKTYTYKASLDDMVHDGLGKYEIQMVSPNLHFASKEIDIHKVRVRFERKALWEM